MFKRLDVPLLISGQEGVAISREIINRYHDSPFAKTFKVHGYGIEFEDDNVFIDFDYNVISQLDSGFDDWRIYYYLCNGDVEKWDKSNLLQDNIRIWFQEMERDGIIQKKNNLFYLS